MSQGITDLWGAVRAWDGFELALSEIDEPTRGHPQIRLGHAILWASVLNDAYWRLGRTEYVAQRDVDSDGVVIEGLRMARNALLHGAALCAVVRPDVQLPGITIGPWSWTSDVESLVSFLDRASDPKQRESYNTHLAGELLAAPMMRAKRWFDTAEGIWPLGPGGA